MMRKILPIITLTMLLSGNVFGAGTAINNAAAEKAAAADKESTKSQNTDEACFSGNMLKTDMPTYIYANDDGTYTIVGASDKIYVQLMSEDFEPVSKMTFIIKGDKFGGYYFDGQNHYIISANDVTSKRNIDLYTIEKYSKDGKNKLGSTSLSAEKNNIMKTVVSGGVSIKKNGSILSIADSVENKKTDDKGVQDNVVINYDMNSLSASYGGTFGRDTAKNYPVDSNTKPYIAYGHENYISLCWKSSNGIVVSGTEYTNLSSNNSVYMFNTYNKKNSAKNNITLDGFDVSKTHYIVAGTSASQDKNFETNKDINVFISSLVKTQLTGNLVRTSFLTGYTEKDNISIDKQQLVKLDESSFVLLWQECKDGSTTVKYTAVAADGSTGEIKEQADLKLSNCEPIYKDGKLIWFNVEKDGGKPVLCTLEL